MPLVKNLHADQLLKSAVVLNLDDVRAEAVRVLEEAQAKAEQILKSAREEAKVMTSGAMDRGMSEGHAHGLKQGIEEGLESGRSEGEAAARAEFAENFKTLDTGWSEALADWNSQREFQIEGARRDLLRFSIAIAEKIVGAIPQCEPERVQSQVENALSLLIDRTRLCIRVHPADCALVEESISSLPSLLGNGGDVSVEADSTIERGGCIVGNPDGEIDARLETQLVRIVHGLLPELMEDDHSQDDES